MQLSLQASPRGHAIRGPCLRECTSLPFRTKPGTVSQLLCTLVQTTHGRRINPAPSPSTHLRLFSSPSNIDLACLFLPCLALPCTRPDPHAAFACSASMHASPGVSLGWLVCFWPGLGWPAIDDLTNLILKKKQKEEQQTSAATATASADSTTTLTSHLQTTVSTAVSMNHPRPRW